MNTHAKTGHGGNRPTIGALAAGRFPLVPRPKAACGTIKDRIQRVRTQAGTARQASREEALAKACEALNLAALIYSDCGMPDAARDLCLRQFTAFAEAGPFGADTTKLALQPLINMGRLHTRAGDGITTYEIHQQMFTAAASGAAVQIADQTLDIGALVRPGTDHRKILQWLWTVLLSDGLRALCRSGHWAHACAQAEMHHGIGDRLLDGRQIAIIAAAADGDFHQAQHLIETTACSDLWERAVLNCLRVLIAPESSLVAPTDHDAMYEAYLKLRVDPASTVFLVRAGLTVIDLSEPNQVPTSIVDAIRRIAASGDGYTAVELLSHPVRHLLEPAIIDALHALVVTASLGTAPTGELADDLAGSAEDGLLTIARHVASGLTATPRPDGLTV